MSEAWQLLSDLSSVPIETFQAVAVVLWDEPPAGRWRAPEPTPPLSAFQLVSRSLDELLVSLLVLRSSRGLTGISPISVIINHRSASAGRVT